MTTPKQKLKKEECEIKVDDEKHNSGNIKAEWLVTIIGKYTHSFKICNDCYEMWKGHWNKAKKL